MTTDLHDSDADPRRARIVSLAETLRGHGFDPQVAESDALLGLPRSDGPVFLVRCDRRAIDGGRLWFFSPPKSPLGEADDAHHMDVVVAIKSRLAEPRPEVR